MSVSVKDLIKEEAQSARCMGYIPSDELLESLEQRKRIVFNSERVKPKIGKRLRKPHKPFHSQKPKVKKKGGRLK